jgi:predicted acylesterase/phospholipase RssA
VFILAGGAALGAHHVGAMRYLAERGITPDHIVASSIGVINACVYLTGGLPLLESAWQRFWSLPQIADVSFRHNPVLGLSFFSMDRLSRGIEEHVDFPTIYESAIGLDIIVLNLSRGMGEVYAKEQMQGWREFRSLTRAGYTIPLLFPPVHLRGDLFVDGGFAWNIPLEHAIGLEPTEIYLLAPIASQLPYERGFRSFAGLVSRFLDVMWRTIGNMGYIYARLEDGCYHGIPIIIIEPGEEHSGFAPFGMFNAYPRKSARLIAAGYRDAKRVLARHWRLTGATEPNASRSPTW